MPWDQLAKEETERYLRDMENLNATPFDHYVAATDHIPAMQEIISKLLDAGLAYVSNGSVYFSVEKDPDFGKLSHLAPEEMLPIANERGNFPDDPNKRAPIDFIMWQAAAPGVPLGEWRRSRAARPPRRPAAECAAGGLPLAGPPSPPGASTV